MERQIKLNKYFSNSLSLSHSLFEAEQMDK
jgi:hypothetical protein